MQLVEVVAVLILNPCVVLELLKDIRTMPRHTNVLLFDRVNAVFNAVRAFLRRQHHELVFLKVID